MLRPAGNSVTKPGPVDSVTVTLSASAIESPGGALAVQLRVAEQYITQFGNIAKEGNTLVVPASLSDVSSMLALAMNAIKGMPVAGSPKA